MWTGVCIFFVFFALLEYTAVNAAARTDAKVRGNHLKIVFSRLSLDSNSETDCSQESTIKRERGR